MQQEGEFQISASQQRVWDALNDPEVLQQCIVGCESLHRTDDGAFEAVVKAKVGPVSARFKGEVSLEDLQPPAAYTLVGSAKGGAAGFARGRANVQLRSDVAADEETTTLTYQLDANVGGKLAQVGSRLVAGATHKLADSFFERLQALLAAERTEGLPTATGQKADATASGDATNAPAEEQGGPVLETATEPNRVPDTGTPPPAASDNQRDFESSGQWRVWALVFGLMVFALGLAMI